MHTSYNQPYLPPSCRLLNVLNSVLRSTNIYLTAFVSFTIALYVECYGIGKSNVVFFLKYVKKTRQSHVTVLWKYNDDSLIVAYES